MSSRALFVSDIHIRSSEDPKFALFCDFLEACREKPPTHLFLVGDIFDLWIADRRYFTQRFARPIALIRELRERGVQVHYFEGNHDLDLRVFWEKQLGVTVHEEAAYFTLDNRRIRVEHGDQMDPEDKGYLFLRWLLRTPILRALGRYLPNRVVAQIGERASHASRDYTSHVKTTSAERSTEKTRAHARAAHNAQPFEVFVSGHTHVVDDSTQEVNGHRFRCFNLGTWLKEPVVLEIAGEEMRLKPVRDLLAR